MFFRYIRNNCDLTPVLLDHKNHMREGATRNNGALAEHEVKNFMYDLTGNRYGSIQNASNHGADAVNIDDVNKVIHFAEIKSSINGVEAARDITGNPVQRIDDWLAKINNGNFGAIDDQTKELADSLTRARDAGYSINAKWIQVGVPNVGDSSKGLEIKIQKWEG